VKKLANFLLTALFIAAPAAYTQVEAIDAYLRQKSLKWPSKWRCEMAKQGFTEDEVMQMINDEVRLMRAEQRNSVK
jgi:hypothetical protein